MRNFKKFLALVLAMLMVSACAISVSAFADDAAVNASKFAEAIKTLAKYEILIGDENGNVNPSKLVRRDEAAVMFAKLFAGADGQVIEWDSAKTTYYDDVDAEWSFGYINYVTDKELMQGVGEGKFAPTENITLAEVLTIAVNANEVAFNSYLDKADANPEPAKWYTNYMSAARASGFTTKLGTSDYEAYATKGQVAQIVANMMVADSSIADNFKVKNITGGTVSFTASTVSISGTDTSVDPAVPATLIFTTEAFATEAAKYGVPTDYKALAADGTELYIEYNRDSNNVPTVYKMAVSVSYDDVKVEKAPQEGGADVEKIVINDVLYSTGSSGAEPDVVGGSTGLPVVTVTVVASETGAETSYVKGSLPTFFKAVAADTNGNGVIDAVTLYEYKYGTIAKADKQIDKDNAADKVAIDNVIITDYVGTTATPVLNNKEDHKTEAGLARTVIFAADSAENFEYSAEIPVLYRFDIDANLGNIIVDVLEVAEVVEGKLISFSTTNKNITLEEKGAYGYLANVYTAPAAWALNQNISFYAIDGKFAKLTGDAKTEAAILVDSVVVKDGKAVITGLDAKNGYKAVKDFVVEGYTSTADTSKLTKQGAFTYKLTSPSKVYGKVMLADKADTAEADATIFFEDGKVYNFVVTSDGLNYVIDNGSEKALDEYAEVAVAPYTGKIEVTASYLKVNGVAVKEVKNIAVITKTDTHTANEEKKDADGYKNYYGDLAFTSAATFAEQTGVTAYVHETDGKVDVMLTGGGTAADTVKKAFDEGTQLVQIIEGPIDVAYDYSTYAAIDLMTGKKVTVKGNDLTVANFYVVKDGSAAYKADDYSKTNEGWIVDNKATLKVVFGGGIVGEIKACPTYLTKAVDAAWVYNADAEKSYGIDKIVIYDLGDDTVIDLNDAGTAAKTIALSDSKLNTSLLDGETDIDERTFSKAVSYIVADTMILIGNPTVA